MVLVIGTLHLTTLHQAKTAEEMKLVEQPVIDAQKSLVAAGLHQALVKAEVECVIPLKIFRFGCGIHCFHQRLEFLELCARKAAGCTPGREFLQGGIDIMDFDRLVEIDLSYEGPAIRFDLEKARLGKGAKRFPNRASADPKAGGYFLFGQLLTGGQLTCEDPLGHRALHVDSPRARVLKRTKRL